MYKIYRYVSPSGKSYIGQTKRTLDARAGNDGIEYTRNNHCPKFAAAIKKYGWDTFKENREILAEVSTLEEANILECYYIDYYDSVNNGYNVSIGGVELESISQKVPVIGIDCFSKEITEYNSISEASRMNNVAVNSISQCLRGISRTSAKKVWVKKDIFSKMTDEEKQYLYTIVPGAQPKQKRPVICVETQQEFDSIQSAAEFYNLDKSSVAKACKGKLQKTCGGFHWKYKEK